MLTAGMLPPDVTLLNGAGQSVPLSSFRGKPLVLFFYPKDDTPGCTIEACAFRDAYQDFTDAGAEVVGVSSDGATSHSSFATKHKLPFPLLSDPNGAARKAFGIPKTFGVLPGRATFVIDASGVIRYAFNSQFAPDKHVSRALAALVAD